MTPSILLYRFVRALIHAVGRVWFRLSTEGLEHLPAGQPFVLAPVHRSNLDSLLVSVITTRRMRYMGKDSMWKYKWPGKFFTALGAFPVRRGTADREALRRCIEVVEAGEPVVIFPEGTRQLGPVVETLFEGAAYIAGRTGVAIVPVGIGGSERAMPKGAKWIRPAKVHILVGPPMRPEVDAGGRVPRRAVAELTIRLQAELQDLFDRAEKRAQG